MIRLCAFADEADSSLDGQILALIRNNISLIELRGIDGKNVLDFTNEEISEYKNKLDLAGVSVWSIGSPIGKIDIKEDFSSYLTKVKRIFEIANLFNAKRVRAFSFFNAYGDKEEVLKRLQVMVDTAKEYGVIFCHENEKEIYGDTVDRVLEIANNVNGIKLVYDPANYLQCGENATEALDKTITFTEYFHIKDVNEKGLLVPSGYGNGDISGLVKKVKDKNVVLTLEPHLKVFSGYGNIDSSEMKTEFTFSSNAEAFDTAVNALKKILKDNDLIETDEGYTLCK